MYWICCKMSPALSRRYLAFERLQKCIQYSHSAQEKHHNKVCCFVVIWAVLSSNSRSSPALAFLVLRFLCGQPLPSNACWSKKECVISPLIHKYPGCLPRYKRGYQLAVRRSWTLMHFQWITLLLLRSEVCIFARSSLEATVIEELDRAQLYLLPRTRCAARLPKYVHLSLCLLCQKSDMARAQNQFTQHGVLESYSLNENIAPHTKMIIQYCRQSMTPLGRTIVG